MKNTGFSPEEGGRIKTIGLCAALTGCLLVAAECLAAVNMTIVDKEFPTYPYFDPDPVPHPTERVYPYFRYDGQTLKPETRKWKTVILENDKIRVTILPEIGGKVWGAEDKKTGKPFLYYNHSVKFRNIAMRGPWCSGGIEFNFGEMGHAAWTSTPVDWSTAQNDDGSVSFFLRRLRVHRRHTLADRSAARSG